MAQFARQCKHITGIMAAWEVGHCAAGAAQAALSRMPYNLPQAWMPRGRRSDWKVAAADSSNMG